MTEEEFIKIVGKEPYQDDLERVNCPEAGKLGHTCCGICKHGKPKFLCHECLTQDYEYNRNS